MFPQRVFGVGTFWKITNTQNMCLFNFIGLMRNC